MVSGLFAAEVRLFVGCSSSRDLHLTVCNGIAGLWKGRVIHSWPAAEFSWVDSRVRSLGLWAVCRLHCLHSGGQVGPTVSSSSSKLGPIAVFLYHDCRAGRAWPSVERHSVICHTAGLVFICLNIRSLGNKLDDLLDVIRDHRVSLLFLNKTWHDVDSVAMRRLRVLGFQVVDHPRPRVYDDVITTNDGGIAAVAASGVRLSRLNIGVDPMSFELLCVCVDSRTLSCVVAVVYRPGSAAVSTTFSVEMSDVLDRLSTFTEPVYIVKCKCKCKYILTCKASWMNLMHGEKMT